MRIQLGEGSAAEVTKKMLKNEGVGAFYKVCAYLLPSIFSFAAISNDCLKLTCRINHLNLDLTFAMYVCQIHVMPVELYFICCL